MMNNEPPYHGPSFQAHPKKTRLIGIYFMVIPISMTFFSALFIQNGNGHTHNSLYIHIIPMFFIGLVLYFLRFQLTKEHAVVSVGKIFISTIHKKDLSQTIYLKMPHNHQQLELNRKLTLFKRPDPQTFWQQHAVLTFPQNKTRGSLFRPSLNQLYLNFFSKQQIDELFQILKQDWQLNPEHIETTSLEKLQQERQAQDIGRWAPSLIFVAIFIGIIGAALPFQFSSGLHFAIESYDALPVFMIFSLLVTYPLIKTEKKKYPLISATICSLVLGCSVYFFALQCNRLYSERRNTEQIISMTFEQMDRRSQVWRLEPTFAQKFKLPYIYIHQDWQGFDASLKQGQQYEIIVRQGLFNDYFVDTESFHKAKLVEKERE